MKMMTLIKTKELIEKVSWELLYGVCPETSFP
jgi:hypothetical protein